MQTSQKQFENKILFVCRNRQDFEQVTTYLQSTELTCESTMDTKAGERLFESMKFAVLLLRFPNIDAAVQYRRRMTKINIPVQTIVLCDLVEAELAVSLVKQNLINDYFILKPVYDWHRLQVCMVNALSRFTELVRSALYQQQLAQHKTYLQKLNERFQQLRREVHTGEEASVHGAQESDSRPVILVVVPQAGELELITSTLKAEAFTVLQATSTIQAISQLRQKVKPDLILMDQELPGISGLKLAERFQDDRRLMNIPIIILAEDSSKEVMSKFQRMALSGLLTKPIDNAEMLQKIEQVLAEETFDSPES